MKEKYKEIYKVFHEICVNSKRDREPEDLRNNIKRAERFREQLLGMVYLMEQCEVISEEEKRYETDRIIKEFAPTGLYHAYIGEDGEVYCFAEREEINAG